MELKHAILAITGACNLECLHCFNIKTTNNGTKYIDEILIDALMEYGVDTFYLTGGEPTLCWDYLLSTIHLIKSRSNKNKISLNTNGTLLSLNNLKTLVRAGVNNIQVSIDGYPSGIHEIIRGKNTFEKIQWIFEGDYDEKNIISVMYTINSINYSNIFDFLRYIKSCHINLIGFERYHPQDIKSPLTLNKDMLSKAYDDIIMFQSKNQMPRIQVNDPLFNSYKASKMMIPSEMIEKLSCSPVCPAYYNTIYIDYTGNIHPCSFSERVLTDINHLNTLEEMFQDVQNNPHRCSGCVYYSICSGGCGAMSELINSNWRDKDPFCLIY